MRDVLILVFGPILAIVNVVAAFIPSSPPSPPYGMAEIINVLFAIIAILMVVRAASRVLGHPL